MLSAVVNCNIDNCDLDAISIGLTNTDYENNIWFDWELEDTDRTMLRFANDIGSSVVFIQVKVTDTKFKYVELGFNILSRLHENGC